MRPVIRLDGDGDFMADYRCLNAAADAALVNPNRILQAIEQGIECAGSYWDWRAK